MLHQLVFQSLLGEIDYGAGVGMGDFNAAGCVLLAVRVLQAVRRAGIVYSGTRCSVRTVPSSGPASGRQTGS